jgi:RND superfamily putative drug exporter
MVLIPLVLGVVLIVTGLLLRAIVAPVVMVAISALSFAASFGLAVLLWGGLNYPGVDPQVPIYIFLFLVALGVDYNIFLIARVREESRRLGTRAGTLRGLAVTGGVITAAGIVLAGTFAALTQLPSVSVSEVGSAVAIGVLVDTLLVRSVLAPSLILKMGNATWWPWKPPVTYPGAARRPATTRH